MAHEAARNHSEIMFRVNQPKNASTGKYYEPSCAGCDSVTGHYWELALTALGVLGEHILGLWAKTNGSVGRI